MTKTLSWIAEKWYRLLFCVLFFMTIITLLEIDLLK